MKNGLIIDEYGNKRYYLNDQLHREDGPATTYIWKELPSQWWYKGKYIKNCNSQKEFERIIKLIAFI